MKKETLSLLLKKHPLSQDMFWCTSFVERGPQKMCTKGWMSDCAAGSEYWLQDGPLNKSLNAHWKRFLEPPTERTLSRKPIKSSYEGVMAQWNSWFKQAWHWYYCDYTCCLHNTKTTTILHEMWLQQWFDVASLLSHGFRHSIAQNSTNK